MTAPRLHVALVHPEIPWNTGNVARTCLATGATLHLVRPLGFSLASKEVRRAGLDYWETLAPQVWRSWTSFEGAAADLGELFLFSAEAPRTLWEVAFPAPAVLVFGSESRGLPVELRRRYVPRLVCIPMRPGTVRSLNLSTTVAVALYEVLRQWQCESKPRSAPASE